MRSAFWILAALCLCATFPHAVSAQQDSAARRLTLAAALDLAQKQNLDLAAARAQRAVALGGIRAAGQLPNPTSTVSVVRDSPHESLFFDQPVEIGGRRHQRIELARAQGQLTEADIAAVEKKVRHIVRDAYHALAFARGTTGLQAESVARAKRLRDIAKARFEAGDIAQLEVTQTELEVSRAEVEYQVAQEEENVALSELNTLLNEPAATPWDLATPLDQAMPALALDDLMARAGGTNPELARLDQESKVEQRRKSLLQAERIPNLGLEAGVDFNSPHDFKRAARGQIAVELPLFSRNQGEIAQSTATLNALQLEAAAKRREVAGRVGAAYSEWHSRETQVGLYRATLLPASKQLADLAEQSYQAGKANILTVLDAQRDVQQVQREYLASLLARQTAFAQMEEIVGAPLE